MELDKVYYRIAYGLGGPRWDADEPQPELSDLVAAANPGRALDLGCGTGTDAVFLAGHGWEVVGVDYVPQAIGRARARARTHGFEVRFIVGDATRLDEVGVIGPFDLAIDVGCYHAIPTHRRSHYASGLAAVIRPGGDFYLWGVPEVPSSWRLLGAEGATRSDIDQRFGCYFELVEESTTGRLGTAPKVVRYHLARRHGGCS